MSETLTAEAGTVRTYRGSSIEELLPRIRDELGANAVILCQREGLVGGVGGFFQRRCVEVEARAGGPGIDVYDEDPAGDAADGPRGLSPAAGAASADAGAPGRPGQSPNLDPAASEFDSVPLEELEATVEFRAVPGALPVRNDGATREGLSTPAVQELVRQARPFAEMLEGASAGAGAGAPGGDADGAAGPGAAGPDAGPDAATSIVGPTEPRAAASLRDGLVGGGLGADLAGEIVAAVVTSALPFANPGRLRTLVRDELALRVPVARAAAPGRRTIAVVGPAGSGKTAAIAGIAVAHAGAGAGRTVACLAVDPSDGGAALEAMLAGANALVAAVTAKELGRLCGAAAKAARDGAATAAPRTATAARGSAPVPPPGDDQLAAAIARADLVLIDTPAAWAGADGLAALGRALKTARVDETHLALRAGTAAVVGTELAAGLAPLRPDRLLLTGAAETAHFGGALDLAIRRQLPLAYVAEGPDSIAPADARALASRVTP